MGCFIFKKTAAKVVDMAEFQYSEFQKIVLEKHHSEFVAFDFVKDQLHMFLGKYILDRKGLWRICELVFVLLHGQCHVEGDFLSINNLLAST